MTVIIDGTTGISPVTASGTSASVDGMTVGRGGGEVANNTAVGAGAMAATSTGDYNTAVGASSLAANTSGTQNTGIGRATLFTNTSGGFNFAGGLNSMYYNQSGASNTAVGTESMQANTTGGSNVAVGRQALISNTTASSNTAVGYQAGYTNTTSGYNTFIGYRAGYTSNAAAVANAGNVCVGGNSGSGLTTGAGNIFIGSDGSNAAGGAGSSVTTGSNNVIIGGYTGSAAPISATGSNNIVLADGAGNARQIINSSGNVYVGTYPPKYSTGTGMFTVSQLSNNWDTAVFGNIFVDCQTAFNSDPKPGIVFGIPYTSTASAVGVSIQAYKVTASSGDFGQGFRITTQANGSAPSYKMTIDGSGNIGAPSGTNIYNASDVRLKKNIQTLDNALDKINALRGVEFNWIDNFCEAENNKTLYGFIAQEVESVDANLTDPFGSTEIKVDDLTVDNPIRVNEKFIVPLLVNAIKELKAEFDAYKATHP